MTLSTQIRPHWEDEEAARRPTVNDATTAIAGHEKEREQRWTVPLRDYATSTRPTRIAYRMSSIRLWIPSFEAMLALWHMTVRLLTWRRSPISWLVWPSTTNLSTSCSRSGGSPASGSASVLGTCRQYWRTVSATPGGR